MGPLEQQLHEQAQAAHERLWHRRTGRPEWHEPRVLQVAVKPTANEARLLLRMLGNKEVVAVRPARALPVPRPRIELIQALVAKFYDLSLADLLADRRQRQFVHARHVALYLTHRFTLRSLPDIGRRFGGRDHTTVIHALRKIERERQTDPRLADDLQLLCRRICKAAGWRDPSTLFDKGSEAEGEAP